MRRAGDDLTDIVTLIDREGGAEALLKDLVFFGTQTHMDQPDPVTMLSFPPHISFSPTRILLSGHQVACDIVSATFVIQYQSGLQK